MRNVKRQLLWLSLLVAMMIGLCVAYGINEPHTWLGRATFHAGYGVPAFRPAFLRFYQWSLGEFEGGSLPSEIDEFLAHRLSKAHGTPEFDAILRFHIGQTSSRWGRTPSTLNDGVKATMIAHLLSTIDTAAREQALDRLVFIESLRRSDALHKGRFAWPDFHHSPGPNEPVVFRYDQLAIAVNAFQRWWGDGAQWPANKHEDPLAGTGLAIHEGP